MTTEWNSVSDDLLSAALISFHRGETGAARSHLAAAIPHAKRLGPRLIPPLALARSLDHEQQGALPEALAELSDPWPDVSGKGLDGDREGRDEPW